MITELMMSQSLSSHVSGVVAERHNKKQNNKTQNEKVQWLGCQAREVTVKLAVRPLAFKQQHQAEQPELPHVDFLSVTTSSAGQLLHQDFLSSHPISLTDRSLSAMHRAHNYQGPRVLHNYRLSSMSA